MKIVFHKLLKVKHGNWDELEKAIESISENKEKGDIFEQFAYAFFVYNKNFYQIDRVYMETDIPEEFREKYRLEKKDSGVDGLIIKTDGSSIAYQVKFRSSNFNLSYDDLTSFWAESEHTEERCIFANVNTLPRQSYKKKNQFAILKDTLNNLDNDFFNWLEEFTETGKDEKHIIKFNPWPHQKKMINQVVEGFKKANRGKMLAACGTGKTLTALWIKEELLSKTVLFVAPNLTLIKQTLDAWITQARIPFHFLAVCSDETVINPNLDDLLDIEVTSMGIPVTTDPIIIAKFLSNRPNKDKIIFSTYQSLDSIVMGLTKIRDFVFDIAFFDEAHRTAGSKSSDMFILGMDDKYIPCKKRLFMTATERFVTPHLVGKAKIMNYEIFSMDNIEQYGKTFTTLTFRDAIERKLISDYKIILCCLNEDEFYQIVKDNRIVEIGQKEIGSQTIFKQILLAKIIKDVKIKKIISYHGSVKSALSFISKKQPMGLKNIITLLNEDCSGQKVYVDHINGTMPAGQRNRIFDTFEKAKLGVISNVRCLTEGVDVPVIDAVYFSDPKNSVIDIIQAIGRSLRKDSNNEEKTSYIIVPLIVPDSVKYFEDIDPEHFVTLHSVVQALRDQDTILADAIDRINLKVAKGKVAKHRNISTHIMITLPEKFNIEDFSNKLTLKIAEINKDPDRIEKKSIFTRISGTERTFKTIGDYTIKAYYANLVAPTLKLFNTKSSKLSSKDIRLNNNNVSHSLRIGALNKDSTELYYITNVGEAFLYEPSNYNNIFKEQLIKYFEYDNERSYHYPYRLFFNFVAELGYVTRFEFVYSLYIIKNLTGNGVLEAIERVKYLRETYPNIEVINESNKNLILEMLNRKFSTSLSYNDIWTSRTTVYNQFNYLKRHILLWSSIFDPSCSNNMIKLLPSGKEHIVRELGRTSLIETTDPESKRAIFSNYYRYY